MKKLYRSRKNRIIAGVCGGLAEYYDMDPALVRLLYVFIMLITAVGPGLIFYIAAWIIVPEAQ